MSQASGVKKGHKAVAQSQFHKGVTSAGVGYQPGKSALKGEHRGAIELKPGWEHTGSADLDGHFIDGEPNAARWDYGLGLKSGTQELAFWVDPHPASSTGEVACMIEKVTWLKAKLSEPDFETLRELTDETTNAGHSPFRWVYAGTLRIARGSREAKLLSKAGIDFPCRLLRLPS